MSQIHVLIFVICVIRGRISTDIEEDIEPGCCLVCERATSLTRHHVFPKETHKTLLKKGFVETELAETIAICKMCHRTIHRFFSNDLLASDYYSLELLLSDEKFFKYAKWAGKQKSVDKVSKGKR